MSTLHAANLFFETLKPWELRKRAECLSELNVVLHVTMEALRTSAIILKPIVPNLSDNLLNKLNVPKSQRNWMNIKSRTWSDERFKAVPLSNEKVVLFKRIILEDETNKKKTRKG